MAPQDASGQIRDMPPPSKGLKEPGDVSTTATPALDSKEEENDHTSSSHHKSHRIKSLGKRLIGRPPMKKSNSSLVSLASQSSIDSGRKAELGPVKDHHKHSKEHETEKDYQNSHTELIAQVTEWLNAEKERKRSKISGRTGHGLSKEKDRRPPSASGSPYVASDAGSERLGSESELSENTDALEKLEKILAENMALHTRTPAAITSGMMERRPSYSHGQRRSSLMRKLRRTSIAASSDTDHFDGDVIVPSCDVVLDNSKTMAYTGGTGEETPSAKLEDHKAQAEKEAWIHFKNEIIRLAHTLKLKNWRRVPLDRGSEIEVERLSGALTNAVYVISPPKSLPPQTEKNESSTLLSHKYPPPKLLLRIYGPQVEHLIDREAELQILRRLARKKIGPRLLGTFKNGRFEQFFPSKTLTCKDLRVPETSKQIAKRMRELHDGIELLEEERDAGPFVWRNWDKWDERCEQVITWLDNKIRTRTQGQSRGRLDAWKNRGFLCGVEWSVFKKAVDQYRAWLDNRYGGSAGIRQRLIFAHNDTQYGNLLRLEPSGESPLLLPANEHKQLIVIDFEYASANVPGLEFANHFSEWCYNYHDPEKPYVCNTIAYPNIDEQKRFIKAYVQHQPGRRSQAPTPLLGPSAPSGTPAPISSISTFMLDSRAPPSQITDEDEKRDKAMAEEVDKLLLETKIWRVACSAQWVAWGVVQANLPGLDAEMAAKEDHSDQPAVSSGKDAPHQKEHLQSDGLPEGEEPDNKPEDDEEFDYLGYAQERAMFFWGDVIELDIVKPEDLPKELLEKVKFVKS